MLAWPRQLLPRTTLHRDVRDCLELVPRIQCSAEFETSLAARPYIYVRSTLQDAAPFAHRRLTSPLRMGLSAAGPRFLLARATGTTGAPRKPAFTFRRNTRRRGHPRAQ